MIGKTLGQFLVLEQIGAGGMGVVFKARDQTLDRDVVLKVLPPGALADETARKRFRAEALALSRLNHPNVCTIYQVGEADGQTYIAMEFVEGRTLDDLIREGLISIDAVAHYGGQIADALAHAHDRGLTHRDMKSGNVMVTSDGRIKVLDFGLAVPSVSADTESARTQLTETGAVVGTVAYMSPEVVRGEPADARSDLWGLGVLLYEMAVGSRPFKEAGHALTYAILERTPELPESVPPALRSIILRCLAKQPGERYQASGEVTAALGAVDTQSRTGGLPVPAQRGRRKLKQVAAGAGGIGLLGLLAYGIIRLGPPLIGPVEAQPIRSVAVLPCTSFAGDPQEAWFMEALHHAIISDLNKLPEVRVFQHRTMMTYEHAGMTVPEIASDLDAEAIVECSALISGGQAQLQVSLTTASGDRLWDEEYPLNDLSEILSVVNETALTIASQIQAVLTPEAEARLAGVGPVDEEAWGLTARGLFAARQLSQDSLLSGIEQFDQALAQDGEYAPALAGKAFAYAMLMAFEYRAPRDVMPQLKLAAEQAIEIDPGLAEAHAWLGYYYMFYEWDWGLAEEELVKALDLNGSSSDALMTYATYLVTQGEMEEAVIQVRRALDVDPKSIAVYSSATGLQATLYMAGEYDEGIRAADEALDLKSDSPEAYAWLGLTHLENGSIGEGIEALEAAARLDPDAALVKAFRGYAAALDGQEAEARSLVSEVQQIWEESYTCAYEIALTHAALGDEDTAFRWLRRALDDKAGCVPYMNVDRRWGTLRNDDRFQALLDEVGFDN